MSELLLHRGVPFHTNWEEDAETASPKQLKTFREMIADRRWDEMDFVEGRSPKYGFIERITMGILACNDGVLHELPKSYLNEMISDLYQFKGWNNRTYEQAVAGVTQEQLTNLVLLRKNQELLKYINAMESTPAKRFKRRWGRRIFGQQRDHIRKCMQHPEQWLMVAYYPSRARGEQWAYKEAS